MTEAITKIGGVTALVHWTYKKPSPSSIPRMRITRITGGHPRTDGDTLLMMDLPFETQAKVLKWIYYGLLPAKRINPCRTSYDLKHILQKHTGVYLTNNQLKDAMLFCGFAPVDKTELNWRFRIKETSPALRKE